MILLEINIMNNYLKRTILLYLYCLLLGTFSIDLKKQAYKVKHLLRPTLTFLLLCFWYFNENHWDSGRN